MSKHVTVLILRTVLFDGYFFATYYKLLLSELSRIATDYGLDGPGSNPGGDEIFRTCPDRPWGPTQPPVKWVPGLPRG